MLSIRWIADGASKSIGVDELEDFRDRQAGVLWVDLDHTDTEFAPVSDVFGLAEADVEETHHRVPVPKVQFRPTHVFAATNGLVKGNDERLHFQPLKTFYLPPTSLVTALGPTHEALHRSAAGQPLTDVAARVDAGKLAPATPSELLFVIRRAMLRSQEAMVAALATRVAQLEHEVIRCVPVKGEHLLEELFAMRHDIQTIRSNTSQQRELRSHVIEALHLTGLEAKYLDDLSVGFQHLVNTTDVELEYLTDLLDLFQTRVANELNRFVRKLTAWGAIGLSGTVITGVYGMNFDHMPELHWYLGYPMAIGIIVVVALVLMSIFKRRGWL